MKPAARNLILIPAVVWLATCVAPTPAVLLRSAHGGTTPARAAAPAAAATATTVPSPRSVTRDLLAFGTEERLWSADVIPIQGKGDAPAAARTFLRVRGPGDAQWRLVGELQAAAVSLAHRGTELLLVLEGGDWKIVSDTGARSGNPLPGGAEVVALAGDGDDIWAIGAARPDTSTTPPPTTTATTPAASPAGPATSSSTAPATSVAATRAATTGATAPSSAAPPPPPPPPLGLYLLSRGDWSLRDALPPGLGRRDLDVVSLAVLDRKLMLALADRDGVVRVFTRNEGGGWDKGIEVGVAPAGGARLRLLDLRGKPALWLSDATGPGVLHVLGDRRQEPIRLAPSPKLASFDRTALATGLGQLRLLASDGKQRLAEQNYNADGTLSGQATEAVTAPSVMDNRVAQLIQMFVVAVLFIWMMGALRQRPDTQEAAKRVEQLNLAPMGRRVIGGLIDVLPILIGAYVATRFGAAPVAPAVPGADPAAAAYTSPQMAWLTAGIGIYLLHTTAFELLFARSLGKFATGTRVAALDGTRPTALALLTRNLLRIVDIVLVFPPIFVFFSPLRQRVGDMAAGTLVVMTTPMEPLTNAEEVARDSDTPAAPPPNPPAGAG